MQLHRHGATLVAFAFASLPEHPDHMVMTVAADGVATPIAVRGPPSWYGIGGSYGVVTDDVVSIRGAGEDELWHWDGAWKQLVALPYATLDGKPPAHQLGAWLWHHEQRATAINLLEHFQPQRVDRQCRLPCRRAARARAHRRDTRDGRARPFDHTLTDAEPEHAGAFKPT